MGMAELFITPMKVSQNIGGLESGIQKGDGNHKGSMFGDVFNNAVNDVVTSEEELSNQQYLLATGQIDDAHTVPIAAAKAQLSIDFLVQLRNKTLEAYNEIMRINL